MKQLPTQAEANISSITHQIAVEIFGPEALVNPANPNQLKLKVQKFINTVVTHLWNAYRKTIDCDQDRIESIELELIQLWKGVPLIYFMIIESFMIFLCIELEINPTAAAIRVYVRKIDKLISVLEKYQDTSSLSLMEEKKVQLEGMMQALGVDESGKAAAECKGTIMLAEQEVWN